MSPQAYGTTRDGRHGKKVEPFSPTLAPIDSEGPPSPSHNGVSWDTETGTLGREGFVFFLV
jgi:hypothetical protein